jgi:hypothetical protein
VQSASLVAPPPHTAAERDPARVPSRCESLADRRSRAHDKETTDHGQEQETGGVSLAKGPVALIGLALLVYGITAFIFRGHSFALHPSAGP